MSIEFYKQTNYFPQQEDISWDTAGYSGMGISVSGTFTAGYFIFEGSNDDETWTRLKLASHDFSIITDGRLSATGNYSVLTYGFSKVKITPTGLNGTLTLSSLVIHQLPPPFLFGA